MQITILGCGWLGLPLAKSLKAEGNTVNGSTTSIAKLPLLKAEGINPFLISLDDGTIAGNIDEFLMGSDVLIIDIPPKAKIEGNASFIGKVQTLLPHIETANIKFVIFISSTSVYGDDNSVVTETTFAQPETDSGKQLLAVEKLLWENPHFATTVLRFGGLIGEDRHPITSLAGRDSIPNPAAPINLIDQKDCIGIIRRIIESNVWGETFNAVAPFHPSREEYYTQKAIERNLPFPRFSHEHPSIGKTISSDKVQQVLDYQFIEKYL